MLPKKQFLKDNMTAQFEVSPSQDRFLQGLDRPFVSKRIETLIVHSSYRFNDRFSFLTSVCLKVLPSLRNFAFYAYSVYLMRSMVVVILDYFKERKQLEF
jgi:hypothetical protein